MKTARMPIVCLLTGFVVWGGAAAAQNIRGSATGPTTAKGYSHPNQFMHVQDVKPADNMYPVVLHPQQDKAARRKVAELKKRTGKKPNVLILLMDDVYTLNQYFSAMRVDEFKYIFTAEIEDAFFQKGYIGGFSGGIVTDTGGAVAINLYTDPQEDVGVGARHIPAEGAPVSAAGDYVKELIKYPPKFKIGYLSNNPPVYDMLPKLKAALEKSRPGKQPAAGN
jgi:hypothetical protein